MTDIAFTGAYGAAAIGAGGSGSPGGGGLFAWTPNLNGINSYGLYSAIFTPSGADTALDITFFHVDNGAIQQVLDGSASTFSVAISATNVLSFALLTSVELNGVAATSGVTTVPEGYHTLTGILDATADMLTIAAVDTTFVNPFTSQIHGWGFDDVSDTDNSQLISTIINSEEMPTELGIYNELLPEVTGPDLMVNGQFDVNVAGWARSSSGNMDHPEWDARDGGVLNNTVAGLGGGLTFIYSFSISEPLVAGRGYIFRAKCTELPPGTVALVTVVHLPSFDQVLGNEISVAGGYSEVKFIAGTGDTRLGLGSYNTVTGDEYYFDDATVFETNQIGDWFNLGVDQPYVPVLRGGGVNGENEAFKYEAYNGNYNSEGYIKGIETGIEGITSLGEPEVGSWLGLAETTGPSIGDIVVARNGSIIKIRTPTADSSTYRYSVLQADAAAVQEGHQYPNVVRVLQDDGGTDNNSEYWYYDNGGAYPWPGEGANSQVTWTAPTERVDGSTLVPIDFYTVDYGISGGENITSTQTANLYFDIPAPISGKTYRLRVTATDTNAKTSQLSGWVYWTAPVTASAETQAVFDRFSGLTNATADAIEVFVDGCVTDGNWNLLDEFWCFALGGERDWLVGFKAYRVTSQGNIFRTANGAETPGTTRMETDLVFSSLPNFATTDSLFGAYIHSYSLTGSNQAFMGAREDGIPTRAYMQTFGVSDLIRGVSNGDNFNNSYAEANIPGNMFSTRGEPSGVSLWVNDTAQATTAPAPTLATPTIPLKIFCNNNSGSDADRMVAGGVITSSWVGASVGFDMTAFTARVATFQTAIGVS